MSQMIKKLDQNISHKRATIANVYASTPKSESVKHYSLSLSAIDTASSSGGRRNLQLQIEDLAKKRKRYTKERKREDKKSKDSDSELEAKQKQLTDEFLNKKRKKKNEKKAIKKKQILKDTDSEWETESEKLTDELLISSQGSILNNDECVKLFEDPCTPEKIRDMPNTHEEILYTHESPIIGSSRKKSHLISKKNDVTSQDTFMATNLILANVQNLEKENEDEIIFHESNDCSFPIQFRRDQFVKTYPGKKASQHSSSSSSPMKLMNFMRKLPNVPKFPRKTKNISIPSGMTCVSGHWNKTLRKWEIHREDSSQNELTNDKRKTKTSKRNKRKFTQKQKYDVFNTTDEMNDKFAIYNNRDDKGYL